MTRNIFRNFSAERTTPEDPSSSIFFSQHQKAYSFCLDYVKNKEIIEIGSGSGYGTSRLSKIAKKVIAIDKDLESINKCRKIYSSSRINFIHSDLKNLIYKNKADVIISLQVIEHLPHINEFIKKVRLLLKNNGILIISTPNSITQSYNENPFHYKEYNAEELYKILSEYFQSIDLYALHGDTTVNKFEEFRRKNTLKIFKLDKFKLRRLIPKEVKQFLFSVISYIRRESFKASNTHVNISEKNYKISKRNINKGLDIIAVCKSIKE